VNCMQEALLETSFRAIKAISPMMPPNGCFKMNVYSFPKADVNPIIRVLYLFGLVLSRVFCEGLQVQAVAVFWPVPMLPPL
jgi:hypothetical protein